MQRQNSSNISNFGSPEMNGSQPPLSPNSMSMGGKKRKAKSKKSKEATRRKKVPKVTELEAELEQLEKENLELRLQLKLGVETSEKIIEDKQEILIEMKDLIAKDASNEEISKLVAKYVKKFSDYGQDRVECYQRHMMQLESLLMPTKVTKMVIWCLQQDDEFYKTDSEEKKLLEKSNLNTNIWSIVCDVLEASPEQKRKIERHRDDAKKLVRDLCTTVKECEDLKQRMERKNLALAEEMQELRKILEPKQLAKFIIWVNENKASMAQLDQLGIHLKKSEI